MIPTVNLERRLAMGKLMDAQMQNLKGVLTDEIIKTPKKK
jgi:hypothetical protein